MDHQDELPADEDQEDHEGGILDRIRDMPVGTSDPNIIGDAGPTDVPPGSDPPSRADDSGVEP